MITRNVVFLMSYAYPFINNLLLQTLWSYAHFKQATFINMLLNATNDWFDREISIDISDVLTHYKQFLDFA